MFIKLLKYDIKFGRAPFIGMAAAMIIAGFAGFIINFTQFLITDSVISSGSLQFISLFLVFPIIITACLILVYQNFAKNLFSDEGYLTLTLPAGRGMIIASKLIVSLLWFNVMILSAYFMLYMILGGMYAGILIYGLNPELSNLGAAALVYRHININLLAANGILVFYLFAAAVNVPVRGAPSVIYGFFTFALFLITEFAAHALIIWPLISRIESPVAGFAKSDAWISAWSSPMTDFAEYIFLDIRFAATTVIFCAAAFALTRYLLKNRVNLQ